MFAFCTDPAALPQWQWFACYLTSGTHLAFYWSFLVVIILLVVVAPASLLLGFAGALALRSRSVILRWLGIGYTAMVRGVPDIVFFLFVPIAPSIPASGGERRPAARTAIARLSAGMPARRARGPAPADRSAAGPPGSRAADW